MDWDTRKSLWDKERVVFVAIWGILIWLTVALWGDLASMDVSEFEGMRMPWVKFEIQFILKGLLILYLGILCMANYFGGVAISADDAEYHSINPFLSDIYPSSERENGFSWKKLALMFMKLAACGSVFALIRWFMFKK